MPPNYILFDLHRFLFSMFRFKTQWKEPMEIFAKLLGSLLALSHHSLPEGDF